MTTLGKRVRELRVARGLTQGDVARKGPFTKGWLSQLEQDGIQRPSAGYMRSLAGILGTNQNWIFTGKGVRDQLETGPMMVPIPLIDWAEINTMGNEAREIRDSQAEYVYSSRPVSARAFALRVQGDSMESQGGLPSFPPGTIIIVDPDRNAANASCVLVEMPGSAQPLFRQLVHEGSQAWLRPLNNRYPVAEMPPGARVRGVIVQAIFDLE